MFVASQHKLKWPLVTAEKLKVNTDLTLTTYCTLYKICTKTLLVFKMYYYIKFQRFVLSDDNSVVCTTDIPSNSC